MTLALHYHQNLPSTANSSGKSGIGILVRKHPINSISNDSKISERTVSVNFQPNQIINIFAIFAPTETSSEQEKEQFYNNLNDSVTNILQHNFVIIAGDFSAILIVGKH